MRHYSSKSKKRDVSCAAAISKRENARKHIEKMKELIDLIEKISLN